MNSDKLLSNILNGHTVTLEEALEITSKMELSEICKVANELRKSAHGDYFDTCSIMNAKSGRCSENCKWCSQSKFHTTNVEIYPLVSVEDAVKDAKYNESKGIRRFSLVTSGRTMSDVDIDKSCKIYNAIGEFSSMEMCASMGLLSKEQLEKLYQSGVRRYHCNLESSPSYFPKLCTTHTIEEKIQTIRWAQESGMSICSGGIIGMGEQLKDRLELAITLRELGVLSIPVNVLNPIPGTPLEDTPALSEEEILLTLAMFRIINPKAHIRLAGGRAAYNHLMEKLLNSGVSASIMGDMLTTIGSDINSDKALLAKLNFTI